MDSSRSSQTRYFGILLFPQQGPARRTGNEGTCDFMTCQPESWMRLQRRKRNTARSTPQDTVPSTVSRQLFRQFHLLTVPLEGDLASATVPPTKHDWHRKTISHAAHRRTTHTYDTRQPTACPLTALQRRRSHTNQTSARLPQASLWRRDLPGASPGGARAPGSRLTAHHWQGGRFSSATALQTPRARQSGQDPRLDCGRLAYYTDARPVHRSSIGLGLRVWLSGPTPSCLPWDTDLLWTVLSQTGLS